MRELLRLLWCIWFAKNIFNGGYGYKRTYLIPYSVDTVRTILHNYCDEKSNLYLDLRGDRLICSGDHVEDTCFILNLYENGTGTRAELRNESFLGGIGNSFRNKRAYFKMVEKVFKNLGAEDITRA